MSNFSYYETVKYDNFYEMLEGIYKKYSRRTAIKYKKGKEVKCISYKNLIQEVSNLYHYFSINNIENRNIGILSENRYEYITIYLAAVFNNVIAPIDKEFSQQILKDMICKFDISILFYTNKTKENAELLKGLMDITLINIDKTYSDLVKDHYEIDSFFDKVKMINKDKFSVLAFTSGTTGEMKGVMLSQYNIVSNLRAALQNNHLKSPTLQCLPMNHTYGFNPGTLNPLYQGDTVCINMNLKDLVKDFKLYNPYHVCMVPVMVEGIYHNIIREAKRQNKDKRLYEMIKISNFLRKYKIDVRRIFFGNVINRRLRLIVCGGAYLDPFYIERFDELGIKVLNGYGLTECSPLVAVNRAEDMVSGSVGKIIYGADVKIAEDGEILVKGRNVMLGYYKDEKATKEVMEDGYFKTGDIGYIKNKDLYITGRKKNLMILDNGKKFSPEYIENLLTKLSYIKECIVTLKKVKSNHIIVAKLVLQGDVSGLESDIQKINKTLPYYMQIDDYEIMKEEFEKTSTQKIRRSKYV